MYNISYCKCIYGKDAKSRNAAKRCCDKVNFETIGYSSGTESFKLVHLFFLNYNTNFKVTIYISNNDKLLDEIRETEHV